MPQAAVGAAAATITELAACLRQRQVEEGAR